MTTLLIHLPTAAQRREMIALAAYYLAERRGFAPDAADTDWLDAERMIDALIAAHQISPTTALECTSERIRNALQFA